jgi:error-prone DNA polymerase
VKLRRLWKDVSDLAIRARLDKADMEALAAADALRSLAGHRRQQMWDAAAQASLPPIFAQAAIHEPGLELPQAAEGEEIMFDYAATGLSLRRHPLALLRPRLARHGLKTAAELRQMLPGQKVRACGIVTVRQRPPTANGTLFITLEDETGVINLVVWSQTFAAGALRCWPRVCWPWRASGSAARPRNWRHRNQQGICLQPRSG